MSQIEELRKIIVGSNSEQLAELKRRIEDIDKRTKDVAEVLAPAIKQNVKKDDQLVKALEVPVSEGLKQAIRREPTEYADILYPVMSPAIRLAIADAIRSLLATINQTVESATSLGGLKTRFESIRTGVPYAELALRRLLLYRVEHVFLTERDTGLLVAELENTDVTLLDSDAVSAMFSAIQSFVQDSFSSNEQDRLTDLTVGDHNVWVVHGPKAMLACVIRGDAPASLRSQLHDALDAIRTDFAQPLAEFDGDSSQFIGIERYLEPCLQLQLKEPDSEPNSMSIVTILLLGLLCITLLYAAYNWLDKSNKLHNLRQGLQGTPGLVVTNTFWQDDKIVVEGLKDPMVTVSAETLRQYQMNNDNLVWQTKPFRSLEPELIIKRLRQTLDTPDNVNLSLEDRQLTLSGEVEFVWIQRLKNKLLELPELTTVDWSNVHVTKSSLRSYIESAIGMPDDATLHYQGSALTVKGDVSTSWLQTLRNLFNGSDWVKQIDHDNRAQEQALIAKINASVILFKQALQLPGSSQAQLNDVAQDIKKLLSMNNRVKVINLYANSDGSGKSDSNHILRQKRAELVLSMLLDKMIPAVYIKVIGNPQSMYDERSVRFSIVTQE